MLVGLVGLVDFDLKRLSTEDIVSRGCKDFRSDLVACFLLNATVLFLESTFSGEQPVIVILSSLYSCFKYKIIRSNANIDFCVFGIGITFSLTISLYKLELPFNVLIDNHYPSRSQIRDFKCKFSWFNLHSSCLLISIILCCSVS